MITPRQIIKYEIKTLNPKKIEKELDESIKKMHGNHPWEEGILNKEYSLTLREYIAARYNRFGWKYVYHATSSELGENSGLTYFKFSMTELMTPDMREFYCEM